MVPSFGPLPSLQGSEVWALGSYRVCKGYKKGSLNPKPLLRAHMKGPCHVGAVNLIPGGAKAGFNLLTMYALEADKADLTSRERSRSRRDSQPSPETGASLAAGAPDSDKNADRLTLTTLRLPAMT